MTPSQRKQLRPRAKAKGPATDLKGLTTPNMSPNQSTVSVERKDVTPRRIKKKPQSTTVLLGRRTLADKNDKLP